MTSPLSYAPPLPFYRRRASRRAIIALLLVAAMTCTGMWLFRLNQQFMYLRLQDQCMKETLPPQTVIFAAATPDVPTLQADPAYHPLTPTPFDRRGLPAMAVRNAPLSVLSPLPLGGCVMQHGRRAAGHAARLVYVSVNRPQEFDPTFGFLLNATVAVPASMRIGSRAVATMPFHWTGKVAAAHACRVFAAQPDPADESHFIIHCEADGRPVVFDGWLMADDSVKLEVRP